MHLQDRLVGSVAATVATVHFCRCTAAPNRADAGPAGGSDRAARARAGPAGRSRPRPRRRRSTAANDPLNAGADLSAKPPSCRPPEEQGSASGCLPLSPTGARDPVRLSRADFAFDGNGPLFVAEMRATSEPGRIDVVPPVARISVHEDQDADGVYEHHRVFVDKIVFPRFVMPWGANSVLTMETHKDEIQKYTDTDGDGTADKKELFTSSFGRPGNIEHQPSSLMWAMDNWMYSTYNSFRMRWTPAACCASRPAPTPGRGHQPGQPRQGVVPGRGERDAGYFQFPIHYGNFDIPERFEPD